MKSLLILGGSGFVGKAILDSFLNKKIIKFKVDKLIIVSRNPNILKKEFDIKNNKNISLKKIDLFKTTKLPLADYIIHAAEKTANNTKGEKLFVKYHELTKKICNFYSKNKKIKFLYLSSGAVYGKMFYKKKTKESDKLNFKSLKNQKKKYSKNKIKSEKYLLKKFNKDNIIIARLFTFIGRYLPRNGSYAIGNFLNSIEKSKAIIIKSKNSKKTYRSFLFSDDLVNCLMILLVNKNNSKTPIYNVGSEEHISIYSLTKNISKDYNLLIENKEKVTSNLLDYYVPNIQKLKKNYKNIKFTNIQDSIIKSVN